MLIANSSGQVFNGLFKCPSNLRVKVLHRLSNGTVLVFLPYQCNHRFVECSFIFLGKVILSVINAGYGEMRKGERVA